MSLGNPDLGRLLFETSPDCVKLLSTDGRLLAMNRNGLRALDIDDFAGVAGAAWVSLWPEDSRAAVQAAIDAAARGGTGRFSAACPTRKGTPKWWDVVVTPADLDGEYGMLLAVSRDVTAAHQAQHELEASEARFRSLVTATSAIVWVTTAAGSFAAPQPAWQAFTGQAPDAYLGDGWLDAVHPDDRAATLAARASAFATRAIYHVEHRLRDAGGRYQHMRAKAVPIVDAAGAIVEWVGTHTDISADIEADGERERLVRELRAANERINDIFRQAPAFMCVMNGPEHVFELVNDHYLQLVGNRDLVGQPVRQALPEVAGQGFFELLDRVYATGEPFVGLDMPVMLQREPGMPLEERFLDLVYMALRDGEGCVTGLLAHGVDQTHRKLAELQLHASRERFQKIVDQAATGVVEMDTTGRITFVNQKYGDMLGYVPHELVGRSVIEVTAPASVQATLATVGKLLVDGVQAAIDKEYLRKDGSLMPATSSVNALRGPDGEIQGIVAIVLDTTESKRAAEELRSSEERYRTLFESMDQGFCIIDVIVDDAGEAVDYRFVEMNAMFEEHTGLAGATGRTALELVPDLDRFWIDTYGRVARTGKSERFESEAAAMGRWFDVYATRMGDPASRRVALLFSDITARKRADDTLRQLAADLKESDRRKTEFLATLAHELRNPLAPIRSGLGVMRLGGDNAAANARVRAMMERQVSHMVHLIDDLLDIARISGGKLELKKARVDLSDVLSSAVETSLPVVEAGQHRLRIDVAGEPFPADVDATRIAQVVANLLNNAAKYTPAGGDIVLALRRDGDEAVIAVSDTGVGIQADALEGVFDMFSQVGRSIDRAQGGLGIGLSLVRRLVEMHDGSVKAESAGPGAGSTFTVRLPLACLAPDGAALPTAGEPATVAQAAGVRVLVVDDNVDAAVTLAMVLELNGHVTRVAHDGVEALESARAFAPQLVFLDIGMPRMNGHDTARAMRQIPGLEHVVLVALTGWGAEGDRNQSSAAGFDHHLTKPVQMGGCGADPGERARLTSNRRPREGGDPSAARVVVMRAKLAPCLRRGDAEVAAQNKNASPKAGVLAEFSGRPCWARTSDQRIKSASSGRDCERARSPFDPFARGMSLLRQANVGMLSFWSGSATT
ncbi:PAS domain-containing protein [Massilia sp. TN1-12]|uniref:PAS domain-containing protein n=1 Tax=Massilia paldalensis TaxID=3377675 RepID=UPI003850358A